MEFKRTPERKPSFVVEQAAGQSSARAEGQSVGDEQAPWSPGTPLLMVAAHSKPCSGLGRDIDLYQPFTFVFLVYKCPLPHIWEEQGSCQEELTGSKQCLVLLAGGTRNVHVTGV